MTLSSEDEAKIQRLAQLEKLKQPLPPEPEHLRQGRQLTERALREGTG